MIYRYHLKRLMDIVLSAIAILLLSPVMLLIAVLVRTKLGSPVIFCQERPGKDEKIFKMYKFRSMRTDTPHDKPTHLLENPDQYITKVGRFLRKSSLDELPQLWNIARGDMAVIGPRPALWNQDDLIAERDKYGANDVKPGLTGWAQIHGRDELPIRQKAELDGYYVHHIQLKMDLECLWRTAGAVLRQDGIHEGRLEKQQMKGAKEVVKVGK